MIGSVLRSTQRRLPTTRSVLAFKAFSTEPATFHIERTRNIGISAHIDSGKTTLTERILFYTGKIKSIHDVKGKDGVGATMDGMDLEREKGITIQSAATFCRWGENHINIIDTPGHVDFTIEVERALRVLDGAILVLCAVSGVQSQTLTVDRQMKRYGVPRLAFINKLDRMGANPEKAIEGIRKDLKLAAEFIQLPIGLEEHFVGVVDLVSLTSHYFNGDKGEQIETLPCMEDPKVNPELRERITALRQHLVERLADLDETIGEIFLNDMVPTIEDLHAAIRRQTIACQFVPVCMGSAFKNKGVQLLLDAINNYLPNPTQKVNMAFDLSRNEERVELACHPEKPLVALAFKLEESRFGQLTYLRIYQGTIRKGAYVINQTTQKRHKIPRLVRMHSQEMEEVDIATAGDVIAVFGIECASMDTFTDGEVSISLASMFVPKPVMSLAVRPKDMQLLNGFSKAIQKFTREDPTLRVMTDSKTGETIMSGMGELHLEIYIERMKREYQVECISGNPNVNFKETVTTKSHFNYLHKKQSGGSGQFARVIGYVEPTNGDTEKPDADGNEFVNNCIGQNIPQEFYVSCEKGTAKACEKGVLAGHGFQGVRVVLTDGAAHAVDSNDISFQLAMQYGIRNAVKAARPAIMEPVMNLEVNAPSEFQGNLMGALNKRGGMIVATDLSDDGSAVRILADVPLASMFGYSTEIRSSTQGKGEFSMEYKEHRPVSRDMQDTLIKEYEKKRAADNDE